MKKYIVCVRVLKFYNEPWFVWILIHLANFPVYPFILETHTLQFWEMTIFEDTFPSIFLYFLFLKLLLFICQTPRMVISSSFLSPFVLILSFPCFFFSSFWEVVQCTLHCFLTFFIDYLGLAFGGLLKVCYNLSMCFLPLISFFCCPHLYFLFRLWPLVRFSFSFWTNKSKCLSG